MAFLDTTTAPAGSGTYTINAGDIPSVVAQKFGITLEALNAANANTTGYEAFYVGLTIVLPAEAVGTTTTVMFPPGDPCGPTGGSYHCTGPLGTDDAGAQVFAQCTFFPDFIASTVPATAFDVATTTTYVECPPNASCVSPGFPAPTTTSIISPTTSSIEPASTTPAVDPNIATTTTTTLP
jgi:LysM repeat protein